jgi:two-component system sensor histidine kinase ResE
MDRMVVELLDISEIGAGNFSIHQNPLALDQQIAYVLQGLEPRLRKAKLNVVMRVVNRDILQFLGDERRIQWALGHLIDNAINYTEPNGKVFVEIGRVRDGVLLLKVRDTGVGISKDDLPQIFDRFYRGKAKNPEGKLIDPRGLGQGLFIAKAVIEAHGGSISVASKAGEGSTFTIALPLAG